MIRRRTLQTNFSSGELSPDLGMRQDTEQYQNGAKSLRNRRVMIGGGTKRRPGTWFEAELPAHARLEEYNVGGGIKYLLAFSTQRVDAYRIAPLTGHVTASGSLTGCPWGAAIFPEMDYEQSGDTAFLFHEDMPPQVLFRTSPTAWTVNDFPFYEGAGGRTEQPYFKVAADSVTMQPSALTGSITLEFAGAGSSAILTADDVGSIFRYVGREIIITAVTDGNTGTGTVIEKLPETQELTVNSSGDFAEGELVEQDTSGARGIITEIPDGTHIHVVVADKLTKFNGSDDLIGPNGTTSVSAQATAATKAAVKQWDEQLFSETNGYPSCGVLHRNRMLMSGHPAIPQALIGSKLNNLYSYDVGDASDGDGIFETIGDAGASEIVGLHSAEQLLIATDHGLYYCPESVISPFRPTNIAFFPFGDRWDITRTIKGHAFDDGVLFVSGSNVIKARPTGNQAQQWEADEVSLLASHLLSNPTSMSVVSNFGGGAERYALFVNDDYTMAVMQLIEIQKIRNFTPWETDGRFTDVCGVGKYLYVATMRGSDHFLELFDQELTLDLCTRYTDIEGTQPVTGSEAVIAVTYAGMTPHVVVGNHYYLGEFPADPGSITGPYTVGLFYDSTLEILPPTLDDSEGEAAGDLMRITECYAHVIGSQRFAGNGYELQAYQITDDLSLPPPVKSGPQRFHFMNWVREPTITFTQPDPLPLDILAVRTTVAF